MHELVKTNDVVLLSRIESLLEAQGIDCFVFDGFMSALDGSIGAIPRRLVVRQDDAFAARRLLTEAGLGAELERG